MVQFDLKSRMDKTSPFKRHFEKIRASAQIRRRALKKDGRMFCFLIVNNSKEDAGAEEIKDPLTSLAKDRIKPSSREVVPQLPLLVWTCDVPVVAQSPALAQGSVLQGLHLSPNQHGAVTHHHRSTQAVPTGTAHCLGAWPDLARDPPGEATYFGRGQLEGSLRRFAWLLSGKQLASTDSCQVLLAPPIPQLLGGLSQRPPRHEKVSHSRGKSFSRIFIKWPPVGKNIEFKQRMACKVDMWDYFIYVDCDFAVTLMSVISLMRGTPGVTRWGMFSLRPKDRGDGRDRWTDRSDASYIRSLRPRFGDEKETCSGQKSLSLPLSGLLLWPPQGSVSLGPI